MTLARDLALFALLAYGILRTDSWLIGLALSLVLGTVLTGIFILGHDAGHRAFAKSTAVNDLVGELTTSWALWPFHVWRLSHDYHHKWTHHAVKEIAWRPLTLKEYTALPAWKQRAYVLSRTTLFFWASILFQSFMIVAALKGKSFFAGDAAKIRRSCAVTLVVGLVYASTAFALGGFYGLALLFVVPQLVYHFWLSTFTLLHHTRPENRLLSAEEWSPEVAQLCHSVHVRFPAIVDWLTHDISWHVPHHVCAAVPHYRLRAATAALKREFPQFVVQQDLTLSYLASVLTCTLMEDVEPGRQEWVDWRVGVLMQESSRLGSA